MATQWYVSIDGDRRGPYSGDELQEMADRGKLLLRDLVWCEGMPDWVPARNVLKPARSEPAPRRSRHDDEPAPRRRRYDEDENRERDRERDRDRDRNDYADEPAVQRSRSQFPGKLTSPGFYLFALLMFLCPWVDVKCNHFTAASQSGLQACTGDFSESFVMTERRRKNEAGFRINDEKVKPAPLIWAYAALVLAGLVVGLAMPVGTGRMLLAGGCAFAGFALMIIQMSIGFPIKDQVARANADPNLRRELQQNPPFPPFGPPMMVAGANPRGEVVWLSTTAWFWMGALSTLGVLGGLALEHGVIFAEKKPRRRERRDYD